MFRTRIVNEMKTGPNFAGRYAIIEIGCGTGCRNTFIGDVSNGRVYRFPYGGEEYSMLNLTYNVKSNYITAKWVDDDRCITELLEWNGSIFKAVSRNVRKDPSDCY